MQHILFISTHNPATNPRLVKEVRLALSAGYQVSVICFEFDNWSKPLSDALVKELSDVKWIQVPGNRKPLLPWLGSVLAEKSCRLLYKAGIKNKKILSTAVSRRSRLLLAALNNVEPADWVIGHYPGALYPTYIASKRLNARAGFDVEDYHPGEGHDIFLQGLTKKLMQQLLPEMNYVSFAAPLIREEVKKDLGKEGAEWITVQNYFPAGEFIAPVATDGPLKLLWYSQNIAAGRGLEFILPAIQQEPQEIELHLYGNLNQDFFNSFLNNPGNVFIHDPLPQKGLHHLLSQYDVGLAIEPQKDKNNNLAISNKLLGYRQAGLYIWASTTAAQEAYLAGSSEDCCITDIQDATETKHALLQLIKHKEQIRSTKQKRFSEFNSNWESESEKLLQNWTKSAGQYQS